jgi:putative flavoprotein involved in K+ transport
MKILDVTYAGLEDKAVSRAAQPQVSGLGRYGHTVSLQYLARQGAVILGRLLDVEGNHLIFNDEAATHVHFADQFSQQVRDNIDAYLLQSDIAPPPLENDPADISDPYAECASPLRRQQHDARLRQRHGRARCAVGIAGGDCPFPPAEEGIGRG